MARYLSVPEANRIDKLIRLVKAATLVSELETSHRRKITEDAQAVLLFAESGYRHLAEPALDRIAAAFAETDFREPIATQIGQVRSIWNFEPKGQS